MQQPQVTKERWLPAYRWADSYEVSSLGRVRSIDRWIERKDGRRGHWKRGRVIAPVLNSNGYLTVRLFRNGRRFYVQVHVLVLETFVCPRPDGLKARHGPAGKLSNRPEDLCWGTDEENAADRLRDGTNAHGVLIANARLTEEIVRECRRRNVTGESQRSLAREFGVSQTAISQAVRGSTWDHVLREDTGPYKERRMPGPKLTGEIVRECRRRYAAGESQRALAQEFGITSGAMSLAVRGINWKHVT